MHSWRTKLIFSSKEKVAVCKVGDLSAITPKLLQLEAARGGTVSEGGEGLGGGSAQLKGVRKGWTANIKMECKDKRQSLCWLSIWSKRVNFEMFLFLLFPEMSNLLSVEN